MAGLEPGEVFGHFADDLVRAVGQLEQTEMVRAEAAQAAEDASRFLQDAEQAGSTASSELSALRNTVITAIESTDHHIDSKEVLTATMAARGRSENEIEDYFSHISRIGEERQPIAIVAAEEAVGVRGLVKVVYGMTPGQSGHAFIDHDNRVQFSKNGKRPSLRDVAIPVLSRRGFSVDEQQDRDGYIAVFAKRENDETVEHIVSNSAHGFERVHFAGSAEEVRGIVDLVVPADTRTIADHTAVDILGLPTMVAYGEGAVTELSARIEKKDDRFKVLSRRCLEGLGIDLADLTPDLSNLELSDAQKESYYNELHIALVGFLRHGQSLGQSINDERLAFWGPLRKAIGYYSESVFEEIELATSAVYSHDKGHVTTEHYTSSMAVEEELTSRVQQIQEFGLQVATGPVFMRKAASRIKKRAIEQVFSQTPRRKMVTRGRVKQALSEVEY